MNGFRGLIRISIMIGLTTLMSFGKLADYHFNECSGEIVKNSVSDSLNGRVLGDANLTRGESSLSFSGHGKMVVDHSNRLDLVENLTIAFWVNPSVFKRQALIVKGGGSGDDRKYGSNAEYSLVLWEDGKFKYKHNHRADTFSSEPIAKNVWTHIVLVRDNSLKKLEIYINGILDTTNTYTIDPSSSHSEKLLIGTGESYSSTMNNFSGKIDEIKIYNIALTQEAITDLYTLEKDGTHLATECVDEVEENETAIIVPADPVTTPVVTTVTPTYVAPVTTTPNLSYGESSFTIGNRVWFDRDEDGLQSSEDEGVEGVMVTLYDENGTAIETTTTDSNGKYEFNDIHIGNYVVGFSQLPENYSFTQENVGSDDSKDSDVDNSTGRTERFYVEENDLSIDAGIILSPIVNEDPANVVDTNESDQQHIPLVTTVGDDNGTVVTGNDEVCECERYESSIPSMGQIAIAVMLLLTSILGVFFMRKETLHLK